MAAEHLHTEMLECLRNVVRMCEAMRYTVGLGKTQLERIEKAKVVIAKAEAGGSAYADLLAACKSYVDLSVPLDDSHRLAVAAIAKAERR